MPKTGIGLGAFASLVVLVVLPSTALLQEYLGGWGILAHLLFVSLALLALAYFWSRLYSLVTRRYWLFAAALFLGLILVFALIYPLETSGRFSRGSDRDEALNIAVHRLLAGQFPYYERTPLGGPITPLPGAILLSVPFVLLGNSAYQNIFWLLVFLCATTSWLRDKASALILLSAALVLSPAIQYEFISGGDVLSNAIYVTVLTFMVLRVYSDVDKVGAWHLVSPVLLGIGLASRPNYWLVLPILFVLLARQSGFRAAMVSCGLTLLTSLAIVLPFYLFDPGSFTPLTTGNKLALFDRSWPHASLAVIAMTVVVSLGGAFLLRKGSRVNAPAFFYYELALIQLFPMLCAVTLATILSGHVDFGFLHDRYGLMFLIPGLWACWASVYRPAVPAYEPSEVLTFPAIGPV